MVLMSGQFRLRYGEAKRGFELAALRKKGNVGGRLEMRS
jgi:hypothetical protein